MQQGKLVIWLLRIGIASVFAYAAIASLLRPLDWIGFMPPFIRHLLPGYQMLFAFSMYELLLALWLILSWKTFYAGLLAAATMGGIIVLNLSQLDITFRDFAIVCMALALSAATYKKK